VFTASGFKVDWEYGCQLMLWIQLLGAFLVAFTVASLFPAPAAMAGPPQKTEQGIEF